MTVPNRPPTMQDVADLVGVSKQTVSAVINAKPGITPETQARVREAVKTLGYRPYSVARSLRTRQTHTIALLVPDIANPSFAAIASAAEDYLHSLGYSLALYNTHDDPQRESSYLQMASQRWVDGMLFVSTGDEVSGLKAIEEVGIPAVAIDRIPSGYSGAAVTLDNLQAGCLAAEHLLDQGHTRLAHISGPRRLRLARERMEGFQQRIEARGLRLLASSEGNWLPESGYRAMLNFLQSTERPVAERPTAERPTAERPTAVFAANDRMAIGAMRAIKEAGLRIPEDVSVIGLDDIEVSAYQNPQLTTLRQSFADLAVTAARLLLELLSGNEQATEGPAPQQVLIAPELVVRQSTGPLASHR